MRAAWLLAVLWGCGEASRGRDCEPVRQTGCEGDRVCAVAANGTPTCFAPVATPAQEGERCEAADACDAGLGCVRVAGVARCLRFCAPSEDTDDAPCLEGAVPPGDHPHSQQARCLSVVVDRPDIGVCVLPCHPISLDDRDCAMTASCPEPDCPEGLVCAASVLAGMAVCAAPGMAAAGEECGPDAPCGDGLACVAEGAEQVCRPFETTVGCMGDTVSRPIPGVLDATLTPARALRVCAPR